MSGLIGPDDEDVRHVAFYGTGIKSVNGDGKWSETICLPDQPVKARGFIYIVR